jgi:hypothetical protein
MRYSVLGARFLILGPPFGYLQRGHFEELLAVDLYPGRCRFACRRLFKVGRHEGPCLQGLGTRGITEGAFGIGFGHIGITGG